MEKLSVISVWMTWSCLWKMIIKCKLSFSYSSNLTMTSKWNLGLTDVSWLHWWKENYQTHATSSKREMLRKKKLGKCEGDGSGRLLMKDMVRNECYQSVGTSLKTKLNARNKTKATKHVGYFCDHIQFQCYKLVPLWDQQSQVSRKRNKIFFMKTCWIGETWELIESNSSNDNHSYRSLASRSRILSWSSLLSFWKVDIAISALFETDSNLLLRLSSSWKDCFRVWIVCSKLFSVVLLMSSWFCNSLILVSFSSTWLS